MNTRSSGRGAFFRLAKGKSKSDARTTGNIRETCGSASATEPCWSRAPHAKHPHAVTLRQWKMLCARPCMQQMSPPESQDEASRSIVSHKVPEHITFNCHEFAVHAKTPGRNAISVDNAHATNKRFNCQCMKLHAGRRHESTHVTFKCGRLKCIEMHTRCDEEYPQNFLKIISQ